MIRIFATMACLAMMVGCNPFAEETTTTVAEPTTTPAPNTDPVSNGLDASVGTESATNTTNTTSTKTTGPINSHNTPVVVEEVIVTPSTGTNTK